MFGQPSEAIHHIIQNCEKARNVGNFTECRDHFIESKKKKITPINRTLVNEMHIDFKI